MSLEPAGGLFGTYAGAQMQRYIPERWTRLLPGRIVAALALAYVIQYFR